MVGLDPQLTYLRIAAAADCIRAGAVLVATNRDAALSDGARVPAGRRVGGGGRRDASRTTARVTIGKPEPYLLEAAATSVGADVTRAVMIGDALTDVAAGRAVGARTVLMLTGVTSREIADALPSRPASDADRRRRR